MSEYSIIENHSYVQLTWIFDWDEMNEEQS